jgi:sugar O-acyltransferase (sialic acid O-acetyltransferase NeuD family)
MKSPVIILGAGGHAKGIIAALRCQAATILGLTDADPALKGSILLGVQVLGTDEVLAQYAPESILLVNALGSTRLTANRKALYETFRAKGYSFATVVHPSAVITEGVVLAEGVHVMAGAVIQPGSVIGENTIVNSNATVDHDCTIGAHVHLAPGVTLSGGVRVGDGAHVGTAVTVIQGIIIGARCLVAAGAVVVEDVPAGVTVMGVPARVVVR